MNTYKRFPYPKEIISHSVWLYYRFNLNFRDIEELLPSRGIHVTYKTFRQWCLKFTPSYPKSPKKRQKASYQILQLQEATEEPALPQPDNNRQVDNLQSRIREQDIQVRHDTSQYVTSLKLA